MDGLVVHTVFLPRRCHSWRSKSNNLSAPTTSNLQGKATQGNNLLRQNWEARVKSRDQGLRLIAALTLESS